MIKIYKNTIKSPAIKKLNCLEPGSWIQAINPNKEDIDFIIDKMNIDPTIVEDGLDENEISRVEMDGDNFYMIIRLPITNDGFISTVPLLVIINDENIATVCREEENITSFLLEKDKDFQTAQTTSFVLKIIAEIFRSYDYYLNKILKDIKEKKITINHLRNRDILFLVQEEETLNDFISSLAPTINITEKLSRGRYLTIYDKDAGMMEDLVWDSKQTLEFSGSGLKSIKNIREAYTAILTNDLNRIMKILTITTIILTVPTIVSSIFGMNVMLPFQQDPLAFLYIMGMICISSIMLFVVIVKRRWL